MSRLILVLAATTASTALTSAQSASPIPTTTQVFFPYPEGNIPLNAFVIAQDATATTLAIQCAPQATTECDFPSPITVTVGPSTFHLDPTGIYYPLGLVDCTLSGTTAAVCAVTAGIYDDPDIGYRSDNGWLDVTTPAASSTTNTATFAETDLGYITVTIPAALLQSESSTSSGHTNTASRTNPLASTPMPTGASDSSVNTATTPMITATGAANLLSNTLTYAGLLVSLVTTFLLS
ncbi:hypothetical protein LTS08_005628 [Lithohypha guttulata]|uniref:uncharacterized protein n=1 Tax=Lithohypha guttulata TaxID=1690604 RepID=UPI002DDDDA46|nr:hypothetical protein LTR51_003202 [Lithohypha guttulata]KAK5099913.1 hypothetical protein LTS08_005628 [Lithohypha guttulata]